MKHGWPSKIRIAVISAIFAFYSHGTSYSSSIPQTLDRIPILFESQNIWEITSTEIANWAGDNPVIKYPGDLD